MLSMATAADMIDMHDCELIRSCSSAKQLAATMQGIGISSVLGVRTSA